MLLGAKLGYDKDVKPLIKYRTSCVQKITGLRLFTGLWQGVRSKFYTDFSAKKQILVTLLRTASIRYNELSWVACLNT